MSVYSILLVYGGEYEYIRRAVWFSSRLVSIVAVMCDDDGGTMMVHGFLHDLLRGSRQSRIVSPAMAGSQSRSDGLIGLLT
jgi:hypothetical protein